MRKTLDYCLALLATNVKAAVAARGAFWLQAGFMFLNNLIYMSVWWIFFQRYKSIGAWRADDTFVLFGLLCLSYGAGCVFAGGARELSRIVVDGALDIYLTQPKRPLLQIVLSRTYAQGWGDMLSGALLVAYSGKVSAAGIPAVVFVCLCGAAIFTATNVAVQSVAFWAGPVDSLGRQFTEFLITFSAYPDNLFGGWLRVLLFTAIPAGYLGYLPARIVSDFSWGQAGILFAAALAYSALAVGIFSIGLRRYESGNQFVTGAG